MRSNYNPDVLSCLANLSNDEVFTPPAVVNKMLDMLPLELWSDSKATFLDPVSKTGVFLREIAKRLMKGLSEEIPDLQQRANHIFTKQLYGIAITELTSLLSRRSLYCSKRANGTLSVCSAFDSEEGNILFTPTKHTWERGRCKFCGASQEVYERVDDLESHAYQFIHTNNPETIFKNMRFDVIIGNPPYQMSTGGGSAQATPLYNKFVEQAKKLNPRFLTMIIPSRWYAGGMGLDNFRESMLKDKSIRYLVDFSNAKECFPSSSIGGGVCYFLWDRDNKGNCVVVNKNMTNENISERALSEFPTFVRYNQAVHIINKIDNFNFIEKCSSLSPFGIPSSMRGSATQFKESIKLYSSQGLSYISNSKNYLTNQWYDCYKVMISKTTAEHAGEPDRNGAFKVLSTIKVLEPTDVCTFSYFIIGSFHNEEEAENVVTYLKTKLIRFLILQAVTSINLSKDKFQFVPIQDFTEEWTDEKLYKKYGITQDEIAFIDSMIRPMD